MKTNWACALLLLASGLGPQGAAALTVGQTDTFAGGSLDNWFAGGLGPGGGVPPVPPKVVTSGGPGGVSDSFMLITSNGGLSAGSRLVAINAAQWAGNYLASGVAGIGMDLKNFGNTDLTIRLLLEDPMGGPPADEAVTTAGVFLPHGGGWTHAFFTVSPGSFSLLSGSILPLLGNATLLRIINAPTAGDAVQIAGVLGVDNIQAVPVPEPETYALMLAGLGALGFAARRRKK